MPLLWRLFPLLNIIKVSAIPISMPSDLKMACHENANANVQHNAMETLLVHKDIAAEYLPKMGAIFNAQNVTLIGDPICCQQIPSAQPASEEDWYAEYLDLTLSIRVVHHIEEAIDHINHYGSGHSDAIVTQNETAKISQPKSTLALSMNASTRFTDGSEFGMGAEIGISTDKLHARGPMGLEELTTYKFVIEVQVRFANNRMEKTNFTGQITIEYYFASPMGCSSIG